MLLPEIPELVLSFVSDMKRLHGFGLSCLQVDYSAFGNMVIELHSREYRIRLVKDRDIWEIEVASRESGTDWFDAELLRAADERRNITNPMSFDERAAYLRDNWKRVISVLKSSEGQANLLAVRRERAHQLKMRLGGQ